MTRLSDHESLDLRSGQVATAVKGSPKLLLAKLSELSDTYALDFEQPPPDWQAGEPIQRRLAAGLQGRDARHAVPQRRVRHPVPDSLLTTPGPPACSRFTRTVGCTYVSAWSGRAFSTSCSSPAVTTRLNRRGVVFEAPQVLVPSARRIRGMR